MELTFGQHQAQMSSRMQRYPRLSALVKRLFGYTHVGNYARSRVFRKLINALPMSEMDRILDLGCGQGEYTFLMAQHYASKQILGLDIEPGRLQQIDAIARNNAIRNLTTHCGPIEEMERLDKGFDLIYSVDVFEHIPESEMPFEAAFDHLNPGGYLMVKMPARTQRTIFPDHFFQAHQQWLEQEHVGQVYELADLEERMQKAGFEIATSFYADGFWARLAWEINYLARKLNPAMQLACLPLAKWLVRLDERKDFKTSGNTIQVIGRKPKKSPKDER